MTRFEADHRKLLYNAAQNQDYAHQLRAWVEKFDNPAHYAALERSAGVVAYPFVTALRMQASMIRKIVDELAGAHDQSAQNYTDSANDIARTDESGESAVRSAIPQR